MINGFNLTKSPHVNEVRPLKGVNRGGLSSFKMDLKGFKGVEGL